MPEHNAAQATLRYVYEAPICWRKVFLEMAILNKISRKLNRICPEKAGNVEQADRPRRTARIDRFKSGIFLEIEAEGQLAAPYTRNRP